MMDVSLFLVWGLGLFALILGALAAYAGYRSGQRQARRAEENLKLIVADEQLMERFEQANSTIFAIQDGIRHRKLSQKDRIDIFRKLQQVEQTYQDVIRQSDIHAT